MSDAAILTALAEFVKAIGTGGLSVLLLILAGCPVLVIVFITRSNEKLRNSINAQQAASEKRFDAVVRMYENNVVLVDDYQKIATTLVQTVKDNTEALTSMKDLIKYILKDKV